MVHYLPASSIAGLADRSLTPLTAPTSDDRTPGNLETELSLGATTFYFRHEFTYAGSPTRTTLDLQLLIDDGAIVYLNGDELHRENMPEGGITHQTLARDDIANARLTAPIAVPSTSLRTGNRNKLQTNRPPSTSTCIVRVVPVRVSVLIPLCTLPAASEKPRQGGGT